MIRNKNKANNGITLIALVITIIVLLILAGVTIATLTGENGILTKANEGKEQTEISSEKEIISLGVSAVKGKKISKGDNTNIKDFELQEELDTSVGEGKTEVVGEEILRVTFTESKREYTVNTATGEITYNQVNGKDEEEITNLDLGEDGIYLTDSSGKIHNRYTFYGVNSNPLLLEKEEMETMNCLENLNIPKASEVFENGFLGTNGKIYQWNTSMVENSSKPICINDMPNSILKNKRIEKVISLGGEWYSQSLIVALDNEGKLYIIQRESVDEEIESICLNDIEGSSLKDKKVKNVYTHSGFYAIIDEENKLHVYGNNYYGQLGTGNNDNVDIPICITEKKESILYDKKIKEVHISDVGSTMIVLDEEGNLYGTGESDDYCFGDGTNTNKNQFFCLNNVNGSALQDKNIVSISVGRDALAIDSEGKLYTWGGNSKGELGNGTTSTAKKPICISNITTSALYNKKIVKAYTGNRTVYVIDEEGKVYSWGDKNYPLGFDTNTNQLMPVCISDLSGNALKGKKIVEMIVNSYITMALDSEGKIYTWGEQPGDGFEDRYYERKAPICLNDDMNNPLYNIRIEKMYASDHNECNLVIDEDGNVYTWGESIGNGVNGMISFLPICITEQVTQLTTGEIVKTSYGRLALDENGKVYDLYQGNIYGYKQLNSNDSDTILSGKTIDFIEGNAMIDTEGQVYLYSYDNEKYSIENISKNTLLKDKKITDISMGDGHYIALDSNGKVYTWGLNDYGQLGDGTNQQSYLPICISDNNNIIYGKKIIDVEAGEKHCIIVDSDGKVYTWGNNEFGQLGNQNNNNLNNPICISDIDGNILNGKKIIKASASNHNIVLDSNGKVYSWGENYFGGLGNMESESINTPICINDIESNTLKNKQIVQILARGEHSLFLTEDKEVYYSGGSIQPS